MSGTSKQNPLSMVRPSSVNPSTAETPKGWSELQCEADILLTALNEILANNGIETLPETPRRPDIRLIIQNTGDKDIQFYNPGNHSNNKQEVIPPSKSAMVMLQGETLEEQDQNAWSLFEEYDLDQNGFSAEFLKDLLAGKLSDRIKEAYGPADLSEQASKFVELDWKSEDGSTSLISPTITSAAAYGARPPSMETVFRTTVPIFMKGTHTIAESFEMEGMCVAVSKHWQTGEISTRPIVPSEARGFYGEHYASIPEVTLHLEGDIQSVDLKNGQVIECDPEGAVHATPVKPGTQHPYSLRK